MSLQVLAPNVFELGASHRDRPMFDSLMPLEYGTTYNTYVIVGETHTALIDPVDPMKTDVLLRNLKEAGIEKVDYIINLHTEQDHAGSTPAIRKLYPDAQLVATKAVVDLMETHLHIPRDQFRIMAAGETLDLGGRTLEFRPIPFAHWPDNTMVYLVEEGILFSSDLFGAHFAMEENKYETSSDILAAATRAYYAEIMMPYNVQVAKYTKQTRELAPRMIAPAHGLIWYDPDFVLSLYETYTGDRKRQSVIVGYVSMHDSTRVMVETLAIQLAKRGVQYSVRNLVTHPADLMVQTGHMATDLVDAAAMVIAGPTVLTGPHPGVAYAAVLFNAIKPRIKYFGYMGSYGWGGKAAETIDALTGNLKVDRLETLMVKGLPNDTDKEAIRAWADDLADKVLAIPDPIV